MRPPDRAPAAAGRSSLAERAYQALLWCYPADFRRTYGGPMAQLFRDLLREARQRGPLAPALVWLQVGIETAGAAPLEHLSNWRQVMNKSVNLPADPAPAPAATMHLGAVLLSTGLIAGGVLAKIILAEVYQNLPAGVLVQLVTCILAAVLVEVAARARGAVLGATALLLAGTLLPLLWLADRTAWLRENPLHIGFVLLLAAAGLTRQRRWLLLVLAGTLAVLQIGAAFI